MILDVDYWSGCGGTKPEERIPRDSYKSDAAFLAIVVRVKCPEVKTGRDD
jgi:hypothetical protein